MRKLVSNVTYLFKRGYLDLAVLFCALKNDKILLIFILFLCSLIGFFTSADSEYRNTIVVKNIGDRALLLRGVSDYNRCVVEFSVISSISGLDDFERRYKADVNLKTIEGPLIEFLDRYDLVPDDVFSQEVPFPFASPFEVSVVFRGAQPLESREFLTNAGSVFSNYGAIIRERMLFELFAATHAARKSFFISLDSSVDSGHSFRFFRCRSGVAKEVVEFYEKGPYLISVKTFKVEDGVAKSVAKAVFLFLCFVLILGVIRVDSAR